MKNASIPTIYWNESALLAIPAVHGRAVFAAWVNSVCATESTRPEAIAVELGQDAVESARSWLVELSKKNSQLPIMLGLARPNRYLHPSKQEKAIRLQSRHGQPLHMLPPSILYEELGFSSISLLCLSPTDSIIEAIRCGIELGIPIYGIDLEEHADGERQSIIIEDPVEAEVDLSGYVQRNGIRAINGSDQWVDARRDKVMAARLKTLLKKHKKVLFTGGLAHWPSIQRLIDDPDQLPASKLPRGKKSHTRVLVHPSLAVFQMDLFPNIATLYEQQRLRVDYGVKEPWIINYQSILRDHLDEAYKHFLADTTDSNGAQEKLYDLEWITSFEQFISNFSAVELRKHPNLNSVVQAAESLMSTSFFVQLGESLMNHGVKWSKPEDFPHLPFLDPFFEKNTESPWGEQCARLGIPTNSNVGSKKKQTYLYTEPFYFSSHRHDSRENRPVQFITPWSVQEQRDSAETDDNNHCNTTRWVWPPCEFLLYGTAYQAAEIVRSNSLDRMAEPFEGSLLDGIDTRTSMRARIRGDGSIFVKRRQTGENFIISQGQGLDPTVFIFADPDKPAEGQWDMGTAGGYEIRDYLSTPDKVEFDNLIDERGSNFVCSVYLAKDEMVPDILRDVVMESQCIQGTVTFGNPCAHVKQSALWLGLMEFRVGPVMRSHGMDKLLEFYDAEHQMEIDLNDWSTSLVRLAIPYARSRVIVVAPDNFSISPEIKEEAKKHQIVIEVVPLSFFSNQRIREVQMKYSVLAGNDGLQLTREHELLLGPKDRHLDLLPAMMRVQVSANN